MQVGILSILEEIKIEKIFISKQEEISDNYIKFLELVKKKKLKVQEIKAGNKIIIGDVIFNILWPIDKQIEDNILNNNAIVMKLEYKSFSILFTGDIEEVAENEILKLYRNNKNILESTVIKIAHHGSKTSSTDEFLKAINCKVALIGVGKNNLFGHPNNEVLERLESLRYKSF